MFRIVHIRKEVTTIELGVTVEGPLTELVEEFDEEADWKKRMEELKGLQFEIRVKGNTAYAIKPGVRRVI